MNAEPENRDSILVAYDGSPAAQAAASLAIQIAQSQQMLIRGLHVVDERMVMETYADRRAELEGREEPASRAELIAWFEYRGTQILSRLEERCHSAGVPIVTELLFGGIPEQVARVAAQARLLALGRRGQTHGGRPGYVGSNFRSIAHETSLPLLAGGNAQPAVKRILLSSGGNGCAQRAAEWCTMMQRAFSAQVSVLPLGNDGDGPTTRDAQAETYLSQSGQVDWRLLRHQGQGDDGIAMVATEERADLIVLGTCRHAAFPGPLIKHAEDDVLCHTEVPVILV